MPTDNRFASLYEEEEEIQPVKKEVKVEKKGRVNEKRVGNIRPGKREFDRHSGTGRGREIPKNGSGPRNWGNPKDVKEQLSDETQEVEKSPVEEVEEKPEEPKPVVYTLEEYEAQRKAKMSSLIGKKTPRAVEAPVTEKIERVEEDYFVGEGIKKKERRAKGQDEEEAEPETILTFQAVDGASRSYAYRERRSDDRRGDRSEGRRGGRGGRDDRRPRTPKLNLKSERAFPKL